MRQNDTNQRELISANETKKDGAAYRSLNPDSTEQIELMINSIDLLKDSFFSVGACIERQRLDSEKCSKSSSSLLMLALTSSQTLRTTSGGSIFLKTFGPRPMASSICLTIDPGIASNCFDMVLHCSCIRTGARADGLRNRSACQNHQAQEPSARSSSIFLSNCLNSSVPRENISPYDRSCLPP